MWTKVLNHSSITKLDWIGEVVSLLLNTYARKAEKALFNRVDECFVVETDEIEFDEIDEYVYYKRISV